MSAHVLLNILNKLSKSDKMQGLLSICRFFTSLVSSIIQEHISYDPKTTLKLRKR